MVAAFLPRIVALLNCLWGTQFGHRKRRVFWLLCDQVSASQLHGFSAVICAPGFLQ